MAANEGKPVTRTLNSLEDTEKLAFDLAAVLKEGDLLLFTGDIGAGKTTFIQALAKGLGVKERVTSPTFVIQRIWDSGRVSLNHVDLYRMNSDEEAEETGFEDYYEPCVTVVEWADRYSRFVPPYLKLHFEYGKEENQRVVTITPAGKEWDNRIV